MEHINSDIDPHRLPPGVTPERYRLTLRPDIDSASFSGRVSIEATVDEPTETVVMNAIELGIERATITPGNAATVDATVDATVSLDHELERVTLGAGQVLGVGPVTIDIDFTGVLNDKLRGFYRSTFTDDDGIDHTIATTQFESTNARRCFPCWDEPAHKAVFEVTLEVPDHLLAVSAMSEIGRTSLADGIDRVEFAPTPRMSTYLLAFVVGELEATEPIDVDGVPVRMIHRPGCGDQVQFGLDAAVFCTRWLADYFAVPYFGDKLDLLAIPDFAFGAMENTGCVTFREVLLLIDPDSTTLPEQQRSVAVIAHELAHMWFGNLVTMAWWEGLWLKEAFATFMEVSATDAYRPDWKIWESFALDRSGAYEIDALHTTRAIEFDVHSPADAEAMYDVLTYEKGASVVRMLEQFVGPDAFREGIRTYMRTHAFGNTVTRDLWDAIESATDLPVADIMHEWIYTGGFPLVDVRLEANEIALDQRPFRLLESTDPDQAAIDASLEWKVPVTVAAGLDTERVLMVPQGRVPVADPDATVIADPASDGFFRVRYDRGLGERLANDLMSLTPNQRYRLFDDQFNLVLAGLADVDEFVELSRGLDGESSHPVWRAVSNGWQTLSHMANDRDGQARVGEMWSAIAAPHLSQLGFERRGAEDPLVNEVRATLYGTLGILSRDDEVIEHARRVVDGSIAVDNASIEGAAARVLAATGDRSDYDDLFARYQNATSVQAERRYLFALTLSDDADAIDDLCQRTLDGSIRSQDVGLVLALALGNRWHAERVWTFMTESWAEIVETIPDNMVSRMLSGIESLDHSGLDQRVRAFLAERDIPQARMSIAQHLERLEVRVGLRERLTEW